MFDLYKFDFESGKIETSQNEAGRYKNKNYFVTRDLKEPENIYFMYNLGLYDESTNKILNKNMTILILILQSKCGLLMVMWLIGILTHIKYIAKL